MGGGGQEKTNKLWKINLNDFWKSQKEIQIEKKKNQKNSERKVY